MALYTMAKKIQKYWGVENLHVFSVSSSYNGRGRRRRLPATSADLVPEVTANTQE
jgi:hypothetical protein